MSLTLSSLVQSARQSGASDIHLEPGLPLTLRVRGALRRLGEPLSNGALSDLARDVVGDDWSDFIERGSTDLACTVDGIRLRINVLRTSRGVGLAIRCLRSSQVSLQKLNLHPDLRKLIEPRHGLVLMCGPTGSGKSTTLAALIEEINVREARLLIASTPIKSLCRQGQFFKLDSAITTGGAEGSWSWARYAEWMAKKTDWYVPKLEEEDAARPAPVPAEAAPQMPRAQKRPAPKPAAPASRTADGVLVIDEGDDPLAVLEELNRRKPKG